MFFPAARLAQVVEAMEAWIVEAEKPGAFAGQGAHMVWGVSPTGDNVIIVIAFVNGDEELGNTLFKKVIDLGESQLPAWGVISRAAQVPLL